MAKKKNYWYVLVLTNEGPKFVTSVEWETETAHWDKHEKPLEFDEKGAKDMALGLLANFYVAFPTCLPIEWKNQPYRYEHGHFEWMEDTKE